MADGAWLSPLPAGYVCLTVPIPGAPVEEVKAVLLRAADIIEERGLCQQLRRGPELGLWWKAER